VISDAGQELVIGAVAHLVNTDEHKPIQPACIEPVGDDPLEDLPGRLPSDPHQPRDLRLAHLLRQPGGEILEVARIPRSTAGPLDMLGQIAAARAVQAAEPALDYAPQAAHIEMPPALDTVILDRKAARAATRALSRLRCVTTVTITACSENSTSLTHAPGSASIRLNALVTHTSPSS
jgi:hypothetical protein